jgi:hypothetical protein
VTAIRALAAARDTGVRLEPRDGGAVRVLGRPEDVPPDVLAALRAHKTALFDLLTGRACRRCGEPIVNRRPDWLAFADHTAAHVVCEDRWYVEDVKRRAQLAFSPEAMADPAEVMVHGKII